MGLESSLPGPGAGVISRAPTGSPQQPQTVRLVGALEPHESCTSRLHEDMVVSCMSELRIRARCAVTTLRMNEGISPNGRGLLPAAHANSSRVAGAGAAVCPWPLRCRRPVPAEGVPWERDGRE